MNKEQAEKLREILNSLPKRAADGNKSTLGMLRQLEQELWAVHMIGEHTQLNSVLTNLGHTVVHFGHLVAEVSHVLEKVQEESDSRSRPGSGTLPWPICICGHLAQDHNLARGIDQYGCDKCDCAEYESEF